VVVPDCNRAISAPGADREYAGVAYLRLLESLDTDYTDQLRVIAQDEAAHKGLRYTSSGGIERPVLSV
jgi:hypothetical protein